jgi:hypothetical protein
MDQPSVISLSTSLSANASLAGVPGTGAFVLKA